jgi:hypothetical protein
VIAVIARDRKGKGQKPYRGSTRMNADQEISNRKRKAAPRRRGDAESNQDRKMGTAWHWRDRFHFIRRSSSRIKKGPTSGPIQVSCFSDVGLLAEARRRDVTAVSADDSAGYGIIVASSGTESAAKEVAGFESAGDVLKFFFTHKAGANPA